MWPGIVMLEVDFRAAWANDIELLVKSTYLSTVHCPRHRVFFGKQLPIYDALDAPSNTKHPLFGV